MATDAWKAHEKAVADFFHTQRHLDHLTARSRTGDQSDTDVVVDVKEWLTAEGKYGSAGEPWDTLLVECKYRGRTEDECSWLRRFFKFYDSVPKSIDRNIRRPLLLLKDGWGVIRLTHFYALYRCIFASQAEKSQWGMQWAKAFWLQSATEGAPGYFRDWMDDIRDVDLATYGKILTVVCLGSSIKKVGPGGGKVVIFDLSMVV